MLWLNFMFVLCHCPHGPSFLSLILLTLYLSSCLSFCLPPTPVCSPVHVYIIPLGSVVCTFLLLCTMKVSPVFVLLFPAVLLCSAAPASELVSCSEYNSSVAARMAMHHINEHHNHGYKFRLFNISGSEVEQVDDGCNLELQLELRETTCHVVNPKHFEDCEIRKVTDRAVKASCTVGMTVKNGDASVTKYECSTQQAMTTEELVMICPDCPILIPVDSAISLQVAQQTVAKINSNTSNQFTYTLLEVGRILSSYIPTLGMRHFYELVVVEATCIEASGLLPVKCFPRCPDRAHHAFCKSSFTAVNGVESVECDIYPPSNTTALGPDEQEPRCMHHQTPVQVPQSDPGSTQPAPTIASHVPARLSDSCHGRFNNTDRALHHICSWPLPNP